MRKDNFIDPDDKWNANDDFKSVAARSSRQHVYEISRAQMGDNDARALRPSNYGHDFEPVLQQMG